MDGIDQNLAHLEDMDPAKRDALLALVERYRDDEREEKKKISRERDVALIWAALDSGNYHSTQRDRVAFLLKNYPDTRDSDVKLSLRYWREFQSEIYTEGKISPHLLFKLERQTTIARLRAKIQNEYGLFLSSAEVQHKRRKKEEEIKENMVADQSPPKVIQIFADETGKTGDYIIVGSVWYLNISRVGAFQIAVGALNPPDKRPAKEYHFKDCGAGDLERYKTFIDLAAEQLEYVVFKAIVVSRKGMQRKVEDAIASMVRLLVIRGYEQEVESGRVGPPRKIDFVMDKGGLHELARNEIPETASRALVEKHGDGNELARVGEVDSKSCAQIQLADIFCGALNRRLNEKADARKAKDELADYFFEKLKPKVSEMSPEETLNLIHLV